MHKFIKISISALLFAVSACSFANKSTVIVPINSNPPGAEVRIDGKYFGQTPVFAELNPGKNHKATVSKSGYNSANINLESWYSLRNGDGDDGKRCMSDVVLMGIPYMIVLMFAPEKCAEFKQSDYFVDLTGGKPMNFDASMMQAPQGNNNAQPSYYQNQMRQ